MALLFAGLLFVPRPTLASSSPSCRSLASPGICSGSLIVIYSVLIPLLAALSPPSQPVFNVGAINHDARRRCCFCTQLRAGSPRLSPDRKASDGFGAGPYKIPGELWESMQNEQAFLIFYTVFRCAYGILSLPLQATTRCWCLHDCRSCASTIRPLPPALAAAFCGLRICGHCFEVDLGRGTIARRAADDLHAHFDPRRCGRIAVDDDARFRRDHKRRVVADVDRFRAWGARSDTF